MAEQGKEKKDASGATTPRRSSRLAEKYARSTPSPSPSPSKKAKHSRVELCGSPSRMIVEDETTAIGTPTPTKAPKGKRNLAISPAQPNATPAQLSGQVELGPPGRKIASRGSLDDDAIAYFLLSSPVNGQIRATLNFNYGVMALKITGFVIGCVVHYLVAAWRNLSNLRKRD